jgi:hypothetical protein
MGQPLPELGSCRKTSVDLHLKEHGTMVVLMCFDPKNIAAKPITLSRENFECSRVYENVRETKKYT